MDNFYLYSTKRRRKNYVGQLNVIHKSKKESFWIEGDNAVSLENLAKELNQSKAKVVNDILSDFFLDQKIKQQKLEIEGIEK